MVKVFLFFIVTFCFLAAKHSDAKPIYEFYRGVRAMSMGNAYTAISDDDDGVFYNPAGLALNGRYIFNAVNPKVEFSKDDIKLYTDLKSSLKDIDAATIQKIMGKRVHASASIFPNLQFPNFLIGYYYGGTIAMNVQNNSYPTMEALYILDSALVAGFGYETRGLFRKHYFRFGGMLKWVNRQGMDQRFNAAQIAVANKNYFYNFVGGPANGYGVGLGFQYDIELNPFANIVFATAWQDIGDTEFGAQGTRRPPSQENNLAAGGAFEFSFSKQRINRSGFRISGEMRNLLLSNVDPQLKMHAGIEWVLDTSLLGKFSVRGGLNQSSLCGGLGWDYHFVKVDAATYGIDTSTTAFKERERRYLLQLTFKLDLFGKTKTARESDRQKYPRKYL